MEPSPNVRCIVLVITTVLFYFNRIPAKHGSFKHAASPHRPLSVPFANARWISHPWQSCDRLK